MLKYVTSFLCGMLFFSLVLTLIYITLVLISRGRKVAYLLIFIKFPLTLLLLWFILGRLGLGAIPFLAGFTFSLLIFLIYCYKTRHGEKRPPHMAI